MRTNDRGDVAIAMMVVVIGIVLTLAVFVVPWMVSLIDTGPGSSRTAPLSYHLGSQTLAGASTPITIYMAVDLTSVRTDLWWSPGDGSGVCNVWIQFQNNNQVGGYPTVKFSAQAVSEDDHWITYQGTPLGTSRLSPGTYWMAMTVLCNEPGQAGLWEWHEMYSLHHLEYNATVLLPEDYTLIDGDPYNGFWDGGERWHMNPSYVLDGTVVGAPPDPDPDPDPNNGDNKTGGPPVLVDAMEDKTGMEYRDWLPLLVIAAVVVIVVVCVIVMIRLAL